jgi:2-polyprenyl-3-methyl-5-hydroxy-6-metoxy-1,4-benzoquinol methylase
VQTEQSTPLAPFVNRIRLIPCDFESNALHWETQAMEPAHVVLIANVLRELSHEGQANLLKNAWQHLAPGGIIAIVEILNLNDTPTSTAYPLPLVATVADCHLLATSFNSAGCLSATSLIQLCDQIVANSLGSTVAWLPIETLAQQGLSVLTVKKQAS